MESLVELDPLTDQEIEEILDKVDHDKNGTIEYKEFVASCLSKNIHM